MKKQKAQLISEEILINKIQIIRGQKVILDRDLALLYGVPAIRLREQVKRNITRFPENFMFKLANEEAKMLVSQFVIPSFKHLGGTLPYVFTEHGVLMMANVLKSDQAIQMSLN